MTASPSRPAAVQAVADVLIAHGIGGHRPLAHAEALVSGAEVHRALRLNPRDAVAIGTRSLLVHPAPGEHGALVDALLAALDQPATDGDLGEHAAHDGGEQFGAGRHGEQGESGSDDSNRQSVAGEAVKG